MNSESKVAEQQITANGAGLKQVLDQSEDIKEKVEECAVELAMVNAALEKEKETGPSIHTIEAALAQSEAVESKLAEAAQDLNLVNTELAREMAERKAIEVELAETKANLSEILDDLSKSQVQEEEARHLSLHDSATGLPNRELFQQRLDHGLTQAQRHGWGLAVLFIDLDEFKNINDTHGHHIGDQVLLTVAERLQSCVRDEDTVSRLGGDEFICLLLNIQHETDVTKLAQTMVQRISEGCDFDGVVLNIKASIGIALYPEHGKTADSLLKNADTAMYKAKAIDREIVLFSESA